MPTPGKPALVVKFCPTFFKRTEAAPPAAAAARGGDGGASVVAAAPSGNDSAGVAGAAGDLGAKSAKEQQEQGLDAVLDLPYRMVFAVATSDSVLLYDTEVRVGGEVGKQGYLVEREDSGGGGRKWQQFG